MHRSTVSCFPGSIVKDFGMGKSNAAAYLEIDSVITAVWGGKCTHLEPRYGDLPEAWVLTKVIILEEIDSKISQCLGKCNTDI